MKCCPPAITFSLPAAPGCRSRPTPATSLLRSCWAATSSATYTQRVWNRLPRWWSHSGYVQSDWKVTPNLTLNLGLRYTLETPYQDKWGHQSQFDPAVVDPLTGKMGAITHPSGSVYQADKNNFQPRVGVAWNFNKKMVFRGSWGVLTQDLMPRAGSEDYTATAVVQQPTGDPRPAFYLSQGPGPPAVRA